MVEGVAMRQAMTQVVELTTNLDDASAELIAAAMQDLLNADAVVDAWTTAVGMKKGRPGVMLSVLCDKAATEQVARRLMALTGTFGVRHRVWDRIVLDRRHETVQTELGQVRIKIGSLEGRVVTAKPEFDDVQTLAKAAGVSVRQAMETAQAAARQLLAEKGTEA